MTTLFRFLQFFTLGVWIGSILYFAAIVAPAAFTVWPNSQDQVGAFVGLTLNRLHLMGIVAGAIYLIATVLLERSPAALVRPAPLLVAAMIVATFVSQFWVIAQMDVLRAQMGSVAATAAGNPLRASFDRLHTLSVRLESGVLFAGIAALVLNSRKPAP